MVGQAGYHLGFPGTISLSAETIQRVYFEAAQSLIHHGFRRFLFMNSHTGNQYITRYVVDRINQETPAIAVDLLDAAFSLATPAAPSQNSSNLFDRHAGVGETSTGLYLYPTLFALDKAQRATLTLPPHLTQMLPEVKRGDAAASAVFLAEGLKPESTSKKTSAAEMSSTGSWSERDPREATVAQGRASVERLVDAAVRFIDRWKELRPIGVR
jgi:creatinine amidohydrolase